MAKLAVIQMGSGSLQEGFPLVTAQLWNQPDALPEQFIGKLPPREVLQDLSRSWQAMYRALCDRTLRSSLAVVDVCNPSTAADDEFDIDEVGVLNVSAYEFDGLCQNLSDEFNQWLYSSEFGPIERALRSLLSIDDEIRIILATSDAQIRCLPWQRWQFLQDFPNAEVALSLPQYQRKRRSVRVSHQPRILAILGNSQGIDLTHEQRLLDQLPSGTVKFLVKPSRFDFHQALWDADGWNVLFFAGHSSSEGNTGRLYLNESDSLKIEEISEALSAALENGLQLAIFNSCDGLGLANQLAHLNIPQIIVMREPVPNRVAQQFFQSFLDAYVQQKYPLYRAVKQARRQLQGLEDNFPGASWLPVLCQNPSESSLSWTSLCQPYPDSTIPQSSVAASQLSRQEYRDRQRLLNKVRNAWIKGVLHRSLPHQIALELDLIEQIDVLHTPALVAIEQPQSKGHALPMGSRVVDYFEQLGAGRSLLILGQPGAGKTITLLSLAQQLIDRAEQNSERPLPVVLNLSSWICCKQTVYSWLIQELYRYYQVPKATGQHWLDHGELIILLDGLDEVSQNQQDSCVQAINQFRQDHGHLEMVLCSRWEDYQRLEQRLNFDAAVRLQPLTVSQIRAYCAELGEPGQRLQNLLKQDQQLQELATSPLMLNIMALAQDAINTTAGAMLSPEERRRQLFNAYIERMLSRRGHQAQYSVATIVAGLSQLAQQLQKSSQSVFQIAAIQPSWLTANHRQWTYPLLLGLTWGVAQSLPSALVCLGWDRPWSGLGILLGLGCLGGSISGWLGTRIPGRLGGWVGGLVGGLVGSSVSFLMIQVGRPQLAPNLVLAPMMAVVMACLFGLGRVCKPAKFQVSWPQSAQWLILSGLSGFAYGAMGGWFMGISGLSVKVSTQFGAIAGTLAGTTVALVGTGITGAIAHLVLRVLLWQQGRLPWNYAAFLDECANRILLQKVDDSYIFIHRLLLEHFAKEKISYPFRNREEYER